MSIDCIIANPTGNITVLVTSPVSADERDKVVREMFTTVATCEQVGFVVPLSEQSIQLEMMGGEFCGNATISTAAYMAALNRLAIGAKTTIDVDASGIEGTLPVQIECTGDNCYRGTLEMPMPTIEKHDGRSLVCLDGISHMILDEDISEEEMQDSIKSIAKELNVPALGLLKYAALSGDEADVSIRPLVYVAGSDTVVWENGCASGSIAAAFYRYSNDGNKHTSVRQPGGIIDISISDDKLFLTGNIILQ